MTTVPREVSNAIRVLAQRGEKKAEATYPPDHKPGMRVPKGCSSCASCRYLGSDEKTCKNEHFIKWNGSNKLPAPADSYCSDWYEEK